MRGCKGLNENLRITGFKIHRFLIDLYSYRYIRIDFYFTH